jgi:hypothetical protein
MITEPFLLTLYLVGATAHRLGYIQVIMPMHVALAKYLLDLQVADLTMSE